MSRLTITISELRYRALKQASAQRDKTIGLHVRDNAKLPPDALCRAVLSAVEAFQSGTAQVDDMTVVAARMR